MWVELQPRCTISIPAVTGANNTLIQPRTDWLDASAYNGGIFRVEVTSISGGTLYLATSVILDETAFANLATSYTTSGSSNTVVTPAAGVPLMRYVAWRLESSLSTAASATFRIVAQLKNF
jgi:hypothetical protein